MKINDKVNKIGYTRINSLKVDLVYLWVSASDPKWISKYKKHIDSNINESRLMDYNEINFSLQTVEKFFNWVNKIFIITDNQQPDLKNLSEKFLSKIRIVDHSEIIPQNILPVFNSELIQPFIWKIKDLSEIFIVMDDDIFFGNYINISDIFDPNINVPKTYWKKRIVMNSYFTKERMNKQKGLESTYKTFKVFKKKFGFYPDIQTLHIFYILTKKSMEYTYNIFKDDIENTFKYKTRNPYNIKILNLSSYVGIYFGFLKLTMIHDDTIFRTFHFEFPEATKDEIKNIIKNKYKSFAINRLNKDTEIFFKFLQNNYFKLFTDQPNKILYIKKYY